MTTVRNRRYRGFTLLEILVAFIVLSLAGGALLQLFHGGLRNVALSSEYSRAALLARSKIAEMDAYQVVESGESEGEFDETFRWQLTTSPYTDPGTIASILSARADYQAMRMQLAVIWGEHDDETRFVVESILLTRTLKDAAL